MREGVFLRLVCSYGWQEAREPSVNVSVGAGQPQLQVAPPMEDRRGS